MKSCGVDISKGGNSFIQTYAHIHVYVEFPILSGNVKRLDLSIRSVLLTTHFCGGAYAAVPKGQHRMGPTFT